jgi:hypothetical protein
MYVCIYLSMYLSIYSHHPSSILFIIDVISSSSIYANTRKTSVCNNDEIGIYLSIYLSIYVSIYLIPTNRVVVSIYLSIYLCILESICLTIYLIPTNRVVD